MLELWGGWLSEYKERHIEGVKQEDIRFELDREL
jgi:hypothetical protein